MDKIMKRIKTKMAIMNIVTRFRRDLLDEIEQHRRPISSKNYIDDIENEMDILLKDYEQQIIELQAIEEEHRKENGELRQALDNSSLRVTELTRENTKIKKELFDIKNEKEELARYAIEDAFYEGNDYMEGTLRCLKRQGLIQLQDGQYIRPDLPYEENGLRLIGVNHKKDKDYFIEDNELDEYTKALERELKEYYEAQEIFKKYNIKDETMYECIKRMANKINKLEEEKENEEK